MCQCILMWPPARLECGGCCAAHHRMVALEYLDVETNPILTHGAGIHHDSYGNGISCPACSICHALPFICRTAFCKAWLAHCHGCTAIHLARLHAREFVAAVIELIVFLQRSLYCS